MKTNQTLSVAVVALLGLASGKNLQQQSALPLVHPSNNAPILQQHNALVQQQKVVEARPPVSIAHVQLQQTQQSASLATVNANTQVKKPHNDIGLVATNSNSVIYTKSHLGGGKKQKLDKESGDNESHISLTIVQDFPKKKPDQNIIHNIEMVQSQEQIHQQAIAVQKSAVKQTSQIQAKVQAQVKANTQVVAKAQQSVVADKKQAVDKKTIGRKFAKAKSNGDANLDEGLKNIDTSHAKKDTLTIVQDFRKKPVEKPPVNEEMIQQKEKETLVVNEKEKHVSMKKNNTKKQTTLTIVQEFPKKKADQEKDKPPSTVEMINHKQEINMMPVHEKVQPKHQTFMITHSFSMLTDYLYKAFGFGN